ATEQDLEQPSGAPPPPRAVLDRASPDEHAEATQGEDLYRGDPPLSDSRLFDSAGDHALPPSPFRRHIVHVAAGIGDCAAGGNAAVTPLQRTLRTVPREG